MRGVDILARKDRQTEIPLTTLLGQLQKKPPASIPGTAVFLTASPEYAPVCR